MITYSLATQKDNEDCGKLLRQVAVQGQIELYFKRDPDYFESLSRQYDRHFTMIARDKGVIVGMITYATHKVFISGGIFAAGHISNLRVRPDWRNKGIVKNGADLFYKTAAEFSPEVTYITVPVGNRAGIGLNTSKKTYVPEFKEVGQITTHIIPVKKRAQPIFCTIDCVAAESGSDICEFVNNLLKRHDLSAVCDLKKLKNANLYTARQGNNIIGAICAWDQSDFRQIAVAKYGAVMKMVNAANSLWAGAGLGKAMPKPGQNVGVMYMSYAAIGSGGGQTLRALLSKISNDLAGSNCQYLIIGLRTADPANFELRKMGSIHYHSLLLAAFRDSSRYKKINLDNFNPDLSFL